MPPNPETHTQPNPEVVKEAGKKAPETVVKDGETAVAATERLTTESKKVGQGYVDEATRHLQTGARAAV